MKLALLLFSVCLLAQAKKLTVYISGDVKAANDVRIVMRRFTAMQKGCLVAVERRTSAQFIFAVDEGLLTSGKLIRAVPGDTAPWPAGRGVLAFGGGGFELVLNMLKAACEGQNLTEAKQLP